MSEVTLAQISDAKQRRDELKLKLADLKSDAKIVREELKAAESLYDALVDDLCNGQGHLPLSDPEAEAANEQAARIEWEAGAKPKKSARKPALGRRKSAILPEGLQ